MYVIGIKVKLCIYVGAQKLSKKISVSSGVRQGGILTPRLFNLCDMGGLLVVNELTICSMQMIFALLAYVRVGYRIF